MLDIRDLHAVYPGCAALQGVSLHIPAGKITVIAGPNGCGKSTLLRTIAGIHPAHSGSILLDGRDTGGMKPNELARQVAYLAQSRDTPDITALRLVLHGRFPYLDYPRRYRSADLLRARQAMETMGVADLAERPVSTLSGGMRQKVYIAMALCQDTPVVLMDEPTTFLDAAHQLQTMEHARFLADQGKTVVLVLHDLTMALQAADYLAVMAQGRVAAAGMPEEIYASGCLARVFGVDLGRVCTEDGWQYYYRSKRMKGG